MSSLIQKVKFNLVNKSGWKTNRKIVVFESDDWGSIRLPDIALYSAYKKRFPEYLNNPYLKYDSLASSDDLNSLFELLSSFKDKNNNSPIFTFNTVVANPDFEKIKNSDYKNYYYEPFTATLEKYSKHSNTFQLWQQAIENKLMYPQFHGREHVNVPLWLSLLQSNNSNVIDAFELGTWSAPSTKKSKINIQASLDWETEQPLAYQKLFISEGLALFESLFKFKSTTMIPNNYTIDLNLFPTLKENAIEALQGMKYQKLPYGNSEKKSHDMIRRYLGDSTSLDIIDLVRNCQFEPSQTEENYDDVGNCLSAISNAFFWKKPAIIDTHRLNYIGVYDIQNRDKNLKSLNILIQKIVKKWPDVEFMNSSDLASLIKSSK